jgi:hypothetical protein
MENGKWKRSQYDLLITKKQADPCRGSACFLLSLFDQISKFFGGQLDFILSDPPHNFLRRSEIFISLISSIFNGGYVLLFSAFILI